MNRNEKIDTDKLLKCIGQVGDDLVMESETATLRKTTGWGRVYGLTSVAAVFVLALVITGLYFILPANRETESQYDFLNQNIAPTATLSPMPQAAPVPDVFGADDNAPGEEAAWGAGLEDADAQIAPRLGISPSSEPPELFWDDIYRLGEPFIVDEAGTLVVYGFGAWIGYEAGTGSTARLRFLAGNGLPILQLEDESLSGTAYVTDDFLNVSFVVCRSDLISELENEPIGVMDGPGVSFEYSRESGVTNLVWIPVDFQTRGIDREPLYFGFLEENAEALAMMLTEVLVFIEGYLNPE
jgi:hypothetical protein